MSCFLVLYEPIVPIFIGRENGIPVDSEEIIVCVGPRTELIIALKCGRFTVYDDARTPKNEFDSPDDYNRLSQKILQKVLDWYWRKD